MPIDRLLTVTITGEGDFNQAGQYVEGTPTDYRRWASLVDTSVERLLLQGGTRGESDVVFRVRYFDALATAVITRVTVTDADGGIFTVNTISEVTGRDARTRRRWLELECIRAVRN